MGLCFWILCCSVFVLCFCALISCANKLADSFLKADWLYVYSVLHSMKSSSQSVWLKRRYNRMIMLLLHGYDREKKEMLPVLLLHLADLCAWMTEILQLTLRRLIRVVVSLFDSEMKGWKHIETVLGIYCFCLKPRCYAKQITRFFCGNSLV